MNILVRTVCALLATTTLTLAAPEDLVSPKAVGVPGVRALLYISGSERLLDYPDVAKVLCSNPQQIAFETLDGQVVVHHGAYTLIQQRSAHTEHTARGVRFYDVK